MYDFGIGPIALAIVVFSPLLIVTQAKYEAALGGGSIEWRRIRRDGDVCAADVPVLTDADFARPDGVDEVCEWFPLDPAAPPLGVDYTSLTIYVSTLVLFLSAVTLVLFGPIGDFGPHRKRALALCVATWAVCFAAPLAAGGDPRIYPLNAAFVLTGATAWNFGNRALRNAYLPMLVRTSPRMLAAASAASRLGGKAAAALALAPSPSASSVGPPPSVDEISEQVASKLSLETSAVFFVGQVLGFVVQGLMVTLLAPKDTQPADTVGLRLALCFAATFGAAFCGWSIAGLPQEKAPPPPPGAWLLLGARRVLVVLALMRRRMRQMLVWLIGRTLHWTAVQSILTTSTLYIEREFSMKADELVLPLVAMLATSFASAILLTALVKRREGVLLRATLGVCLITNLIPLYMLLGMRNKWEIYLLFVVAGLVVSPFTALSRSILTQMIPAGYSSTVMSLEGTLELGTSWIGPLIIGLIVQTTGSIRWGCFSMQIIMAGAVPFLLATNLEVAAREKEDVEQTDAGMGATGMGDFHFHLVPIEIMNNA